MKKEELIKQYPISWSGDKIRDFRQTLLGWYDDQARDLPWRKTKDPYHIWVSEIMLQQTQVETVKPYFLRFIETLPTIQALAQADQASLMGLWQGLGYYSRVRNMQEAAQTLVSDYGGKMPQSYEALLNLKGIGPYTAGAIASIAFNLPEPALDGNLMRIVSRLFEIDQDISKVKTQKMMRAYLYQMIDPDRPGDFNQALMDMGAMVMTPSNDRPNPHPLGKFDQSYLHGTSHLYPVKAAKKKASSHLYLAYYIRNQAGQILVRQHSNQELLTGLWHFPLVEVDMVLEGLTADEVLQPLVQTFASQLEEASIPIDQLKVDPSFIRRLQAGQEPSSVKHVFSHRIWQCYLVPIQVGVKDQAEDGGNHLRWLSLGNLADLPISTLQKKLFDAVLGLD